MKAGASFELHRGTRSLQQDTTSDGNHEVPRSFSADSISLGKHFSVVNAYDSKARFFVMYNVPMKKDGEVLMPVDEKGMPLRARVPSRSPMVRKRKVMVADFQSHLQKWNCTGRIESRATMLFLVVICLKKSNIFFP